MAERRTAAKAAAPVEEVHTPEAIPYPEEGMKTSPEEFNQNIKNLVALFAQEILQDLEQRVRDLETLSQNSEAITFTEFRPQQQGTEVPWYQGGP